MVNRCFFAGFLHFHDLFTFRYARYKVLIGAIASLLTLAQTNVKMKLRRPRMKKLDKNPTMLMALRVG